MNDNRHDDEAHTGPIKSPRQLLMTVFLSFVVTVFVIIGLVYYVSSADKPATGGEKSVMQRIQKVGSVEIRDENRPLRTGEEVFKAQCTTCHSAGLLGAPKFGDAAAWAPRIKTGFDAMLNSALKGKNAMPPQGGADFADLEVARALVYIANAGGAKFEEPKAPAAAPEAAK